MKIATAQFPVSADIDQNTSYVLQQMSRAKREGAQVVHFPEACLSGYAGSDMISLKDLDWSKLEHSTFCVMEHARELGLWVILGSTHRLTGNHKPHNSLYVINDKGQIVDRYDKMFCAGDKDEAAGDLAHYSSGDHFSIFEINGIRCGAQICHDYRYPELYREYKRQGVQVIFHSYHAAHAGAKRFEAMKSAVPKELAKYNPGMTYPGITMPATMISYAANNYVWISCANSSAKESCWASFCVRPDGIITGRLRRNVAGILLTQVDVLEEYYDSTIAWRDNAINGIYHSGRLVNDERSRNRTLL